MNRPMHTVESALLAADTMVSPITRKADKVVRWSIEWIRSRGNDSRR